MKLISWNINGIKNILSKQQDGAKIASGETSAAKSSLVELLDKEKPDILCLQEVRCSVPALVIDTVVADSGYKYTYHNCSKSKKGYSGTTIISKHEPLAVEYDFGKFNKDPAYNSEGRVITLEFDKIILVTVYTPNSKTQLERLNYRTNEWDPMFSKYIHHLQTYTTKSVVICGDLNVAHQDIDIHNPIGNKKSAGFTPEERSSFTELLNSNSLLDTFRTLHPTLVKYSWWSNFLKVKDRKQKGWRIDYFLASKKLKPKLKAADILIDYYGSDHAPVLLKLDISSP